MNQFDDIRPFNDEEILTVLQRIIASDDCLNLIIRLHFGLLSSYFSFILRPLLRYRLKLVSKKIHSLKDFQSLVAIYLEKILDKTTNGVTILGLENLDITKPALFISNHRDIALDSSIVNYALYTNGADTVRSATGDNLMTKPFVSDLFRANKCFIVKRNLSGPRELLKSLKKLSSYIYHSLKVDEQKVWIAQREGRAKDGLDRTDPAIIKMLTIAKPKNIDFGEYIRNLRIIPVSISYELDPCDKMKAKELSSISRNGSYEKTHDEDVNSIAKGILGDKGHIFLSFGTVLSDQYDNADEVAKVLDKSIIENYQLQGTNWLAYEMQHGKTATLDASQSIYDSTEAKPTLSESEVESFTHRVQEIPESDRFWILEAYANPIVNRLRLISSLEP
jgi:hypothetical protein